MIRLEKILRFIVIYVLFAPITFLIIGINRLTGYIGKKTPYIDWYNDQDPARKSFGHVCLYIALIGFILMVIIPSFITDTGIALTVAFSLMFFTVIFFAVGFLFSADDSC